MVVVVVVNTFKFTTGAELGVIVPGIMLPAGIPLLPRPFMIVAILPRNRLFTAAAACCRRMFRKIHSQLLQNSYLL